MRWLRGLLGRPKPPTDGDEYRVVSQLYSDDGLRSVEIRLFASGPTYIVERETIAGVLADRHDGAMVGPFASPEQAELFVRATSWFNSDGPHSV